MSFKNSYNLRGHIWCVCSVSTRVSIGKRPQHAWFDQKRRHERWKGDDLPSYDCHKTLGVIGQRSWEHFPQKFLIELCVLLRVGFVWQCKKKYTVAQKLPVDNNRKTRSAEKCFLKVHEVVQWVPCTRMICLYRALRLVFWLKEIWFILIAWTNTWHAK